MLQRYNNFFIYYIILFIKKSINKTIHHIKNVFLFDDIEYEIEKKMGLFHNKPTLTKTKTKKV